MLTPDMLRWDGSVCRLSVKRVSLYCEKTAPVGASSVYQLFCCLVKEILGNVELKIIVFILEIALPVLFRCFFLFIKKQLHSYEICQLQRRLCQTAAL